MEEELDRQGLEYADDSVEEEWSDVDRPPKVRKERHSNPLLRLSSQMRTRSIFFNVIGFILAALLIGPFGLLLWALLGRSIVHAGTIAVFVLSLPFAVAGLLFLSNVIYNLWTFYVRA